MRAGGPREWAARLVAHIGCEARLGSRLATHWARVGFGRLWPTRLGLGPLKVEVARTWAVALAPWVLPPWLLCWPPGFLMVLLHSSLC